MGITISGENNNDKILASDGVIDQISGFSIVGVLTATSFHGDLIGDVTGNLTGNVTGNINNSTLLLQTGGSERIRITGNNEIGIAGANYGSAGQVLTSGGSGSAVSWTTIAAQANISNNADNRVITGGSGVNLNGEANLTFDGTTLNVSGNASANTVQSSFGGIVNKLGFISGGAEGFSGTTSNHALFIGTAGSNRIKISNSSAATSIGGSMVFNAMLTVQGEVSGQILNLKAPENTTRLMVAGSDSNGVEINLYDNTGGQRGILGVSSTEFFIKAPNSSAAMTFHTHNGTSIGERLRIDHLGRVLIGTGGQLFNANSYSNNLVIYENGDTGMSIIGNNSNSNYASLYLSDTTTPSRAFLEAQLGADGPFTIGASGTGPIRFNNNGAERVRITGSGTLSINQSSPDSNFKLYVEGQGRFTNNVNLNDGKMVYFGDSDTAFVQGYDVAAGGYLVLGSNNEKVRINSNGDNGFLKIADNNTTSVSNHGFRFGSWGIQMRDTGGYNHWFIRRNYGGWQHVPHVTLRANGYTGLNRAVPEETLDVDGGARFRSYVYMGDGFYIKSNAFGSNQTHDTGISINQGGRGGVSLMWVSRNYNAGTGTSGVLYRIKWYYDGNNAPDVADISGDNYVTFGVSGSNTLTINGGGGNQMYGIMHITG